MVNPVARTLVLFLAATIVSAQSGPAFDVVSVRVNPPGIPGGRVQFPTGGKFVASNVDLHFLIEQAWGVFDYQIIGPDWLPANRFEIQAQAADSSTSTEVLRQMLQTLLVDRFHLKLHRETRELPVFELSVNKGGVKIQPLTPEAVGKYAGRTGFGWNRDGIIANNVTFGVMAQAIHRELGRPVLDKTGLDGKYDFTVKYDQSLSRPASGDAPSAGANGSSIFTALPEQVGLRLDSKKDPVEVLVIDSADKTPTGN